ncbi:MAG: alpha/beta fold hydrolase [Chloroflexota bacterium]
MSRIVSGAEPFFFRGGPSGCLLVHGFTATPQEMRGLGEHLAEQGHTVLGVRLFAHGTRIADLRRARWPDWYASLEDGYNLLRSTAARIVVIGLSLGGVLSVLLAAQHRPAGLVLLSTPHTEKDDLRFRLARLLRWFMPYYPKGRPDWRDAEAGKGRVAYDAYPLAALAEVPKAMAAMRRVLPQITVPVLLMHSIEDDFVPPENSQRIAAALGSSDKQLILVRDSNHVITLDRARAEVFCAVADFVRRLGSPRR